MRKDSSEQIDELFVSIRLHLLQTETEEPGEEGNRKEKSVPGKGFAI
jgi:hypothetical protein